MSAETNRSPALVAVLSILGILAVAIIAGMLLFQKQESPGEGLDIGTALSSRETETPQDEFDPISWARDGAAYPPLEEPGDGDGDYVADYTGDGSIPSGESGNTSAADEPSVRTQPASVSPPPEKITAPETQYREVRELAFWVQAGSWQNAANAQRVQEELSEAGFPANVITQEIDGATWYRVRVGAFEGESEAEHYAEKIRTATIYESSYVVQAPVTRRVLVDS